MLAHMANIGSLVSELESTGFSWTSDSICGLLYQLHMPPDMTKEIHKDLNHKFDDDSPNFKIQDILSAIQIHLAREKTAHNTISINTLSTQVEAMAFNRTPTSCRTFNSSTPYTSRGTPQRAQKIYPMRWKRGPDAMTKDDNDCQRSTTHPLAIPKSVVVGVRDGLPQCFFCGEFGHVYSNPSNPCHKYNRTGDRTGAHWRD